MEPHAKTKVELRNSRGDVFPPGTEVTLIGEADANGAAGFFVEVTVVDSTCNGWNEIRVLRGG